MTKIKDDPRVHTRRLAPVTAWKEPEPAPAPVKEKPVAKKATPKAPARRKSAGTKGRKA